MIPRGEEMEIVAFGGGASASRASRGVRRCGIALALTFVAAAIVAASQAPPTPSGAANEITLISTGWAYLLAGDVTRAADHANLALAGSPSSITAITLLVHADIMRSGAMAGLDSYERWLGGRATEDPYLVRHIAQAWLLEIRRSTDPAARLQALKHLAKASDADARAELTRLAYAGGITEARYLAELGDDGAIRELIGRLRSPSSGKLDIIDALVASGHPLAVPPMLDLLSDPTQTIVAAAVDGLGKLGAQDAVGRIKPLLMSPTSTRVLKLKAAEALYRLGDDSGLVLLQDMLSSPEAALRIVGAKAMASRPTPSWQGVVRALLQASHPVIRLDAATLLAPYDPEAARASLNRLLLDEMLSVRVKAAHVLAEQVAADFATMRKLLKTGDMLARIPAAGRILELTR